MTKIKVVIENGWAKAEAPFPYAFVLLVAGLSGRKIWNGSKTVSFEAIKVNMKKLAASSLEFDYEDKGNRLSELAELENLATQNSFVAEVKTHYKPKLPLFDHQKKAINLSAQRQSYAWFLEMGLGKSAIGITNAGMLYKEGKLTGWLIIAPKGVHRQWLEEQIPLHMDPSIKVNMILWRGKDIDTRVFNKSKVLNIFSINIDAIRTPDGRDYATDFLRKHSGKSMMLIDESHLIKNGTASRTRNAWNLGRIATYRRIMTGTPISRNIVDAWSQFMFLNPDILGHKYVGTFKARYTIMGGWEGRNIVGQKNTEEFYSIIAPHSYRLTKAEALKLPPKIYSKRVYELGPQVRRHYENLKNTFMTEMNDGSIVDVKSAIEMILRLQQVVCGYLPIGEGEVEVISDERVQVLLDIVEQIEGKIIIWARFIEDIKRIEAALKKASNQKIVTYYGATKSKDREAAVNRFNYGDARFFISNPAAGGTGLNLQISGCTDVIYYSNDFDALHRWQSEDRVHRMGTVGAVNYYDLIARNTVDKMLLSNLQRKKNISSLTLDEIRLAISQGEEQ